MPRFSTNSSVKSRCGSICQIRKIVQARRRPAIYVEIGGPHMKSLAVAVMLLAVSSLAAAADKRSSAPSDSLRAELLAARETVWKAWFDNDQEALRRLLPEELVAINNGEQQWQGLKETLDSAVQFKAGGSKLISLKF